MPEDNTGSTGGNTDNSSQQNGPSEVTLSEATINAIAAASSRQAAQNVQQGQQQGQQQSGQSQQNDAGGNQFNGQALVDAIDSMPEKIVNSLKEAFGQQNAGGGSEGGNSDGGGNGSQGGTEQSGSGEGNGPGRPTGKTRQERFVNWWTS